MASPAGGRITPLPLNESYQSPFDGRWVDMDEAEVFCDLHAWRVHMAETLLKALEKDESC